MNIKNMFGENTGVFTAVIWAVIILLPVGYSVTSHLLAQSAERKVAPFLEKPAPEHTKCVRDVTYMRYHHWELLRTIREEEVRYGMRGDVGLKTCKNCHTSRAKFCNKCHDSVSMKPDCFGCHYYP
jgi:hypothetical protein